MTSEKLENYDMKYQIVKRILGISLAVCTAYGSVRSAYAAVAGAYAAAAAKPQAVVTSTYSEQENANTAEDYTDSASAAPDMDIAADPASSTDSAVAKEESDSIYAESAEQKKEEEAIIPESEPEEPKITLEEYLSGLRCGACGRCCSLLNPHCRNGKHKAQAAEQEYYEMM